MNKSKNIEIINQFRQLPDNWGLDGNIKPNEESIQSACDVVKNLENPFSIQPLGEGGILIRYKNGTRVAWIECYNDGGIGYTLTTKNKIIGDRDITSRLDILDLISDIKKHILLK